MLGRLHRLTARQVATITKPGKHADGGGLYLVVGPGDSRRWSYLFTFDGKRREMGLGSVLAISLADARDLAAEARRKVALGVDPIADRKAVPAPQQHLPTFGEVAERYIRNREPHWRSPVHARQWWQLERQAAAVWRMPVRDVTTAEVLGVLQPMWSAKPETARRVQGRLERILDAAKVEGLRDGENPARWKGHLSLTLPSPNRLSRGHHAAMPYADVPAFVAALRQRQGLAALALEFVIYTAARSGEVRGMTWDEIDLEKALWTVPGSRMKAGRTHRVPLSGRALDILKFVAPRRSEDGFVFPNPRGGPYSDMALSAILKRMGHDVTVHGFRSSFRDWAGDESHFAREIVEAALAHAVGSSTERAYRRGDALEKRRQLMTAWAEFLARNEY